MQDPAITVKSISQLPDAAVSPLAPPPKPKAVGAEDAYKQWWLDKTPENLNLTIKALEPTISFKMASMGAADNPQMKHQAKLFAADAVKKYDPMSGASLHTWTQSQLQSMHRFKREHQGPVRVPDRAAIDAWVMEKATREHLDQTGMEPDVGQLADLTNLSVKRIAAVRKATRPVAAASQMYDDGQESVDYMGEALEYIYQDADPIDRRIIEMTTGYGGTPVMAKNQAAAILGISPSQVTRRSERIGSRIHDMERDIQTTYQ